MSSVSDLGVYNYAPGPLSVPDLVDQLERRGLGGFCAAGSPQDQARITDVLNEHDREQFAEAYLNKRSLNSWADRLEPLKSERIDDEQLTFGYDPEDSEVAAAAT